MNLMVEQKGESNMRCIRIIIVLIGLLTYADLSMCQGDIIPPITGDGKPQTDLYINTSLNKAEVYRGVEVEFTYTIKPGKEYAENIYLKIEVPENFTYISCNSSFLDSKDIPYLTFKHRTNHLKEGEYLNISYTARASINASVGPITIKDTIKECAWEGPRGRGDIYKNDSLNIHIMNTPPKGLSASVTVLSKPPTPVYNQTLLFKFREDYEPILVELDVSARDTDDEILTYTLLAEPLNLELFSSNESVQTFYLRDLNPGNYRFKVRINDSHDEDVINAVINYDGKVYDKLIINTVYHLDMIKILAILFVLVILFILGIIKKYLKNKLKSTKWILVALSMVWTIYFLNWLLYPKNIFPDAVWLVYGTSYEFFIIPIFISIFAIIARFSESCFAEYDRINKDRSYLKYFGSITYNLWYVNVITMTALLVSVALIVPSFNINTNAWEQYLQWYYSTMAQVFASILAIVVVFYTALPNKNIVILNAEDAEERITKTAKEDNLEVNVKYGHPEILRLFVIIYGVILALSFFGLSSCIYIDFSRLNPFIDFSRDNLPNLISLANFEITLLLIPPAISCLYALMRITAFTGTIELISYPSGAKISLIKKEYIKRPGKISKTEKPPIFDTKLITPSKLMLPEGNYFIILKKDDYGEHRTESVDVIAGTEQQYKYKLKKMKKI